MFSGQRETQRAPLIILCCIFNYIVLLFITVTRSEHATRLRRQNGDSAVRTRQAYVQRATRTPAVRKAGGQTDAAVLPTPQGQGAPYCVLYRIIYVDM